MARYTRRRRSRRGFRKYFSKKVFTYSRKFGGSRWGRKFRRPSRFRSGRRYAAANFSIRKLKYLLKRKSALRAFSRKERSKRRIKRQWHKAGEVWWKRLGKKILKTDTDAQAVASRGHTRYLYKVSPPTSKRADKFTWVSVGATGAPDQFDTRIRMLTNAEGKFMSQSTETVLSALYKPDAPDGFPGEGMDVVRPEPLGAATQSGRRMRMTSPEEDADSVASGWTVSTMNTTA